ncbi:SDR family NAD(P)-dependent oxidoreductase [Streptomyces sp. NPDC046887]|uniref:SDR family NAD(P)-dependent oxidoreductase n=1 Tax=Streptomyces sp. NPDC046887 TaxID=3155472 RepID=UPI0033EEAFD8
MNDFRLARTQIAIIGIAGMFPQAHDAREFWRNIILGRDCITDVPEKAWRIADHYDPDPFAEDKTYARRGGFLPPVVFDPAEFAMPPASLDAIGLVQLLSLRVARDVLADARCDRSAWYDPARTGVILGVCGQNTTMLPLGARLFAPVVRESALSCGLSERDADELVRRVKAAWPSWTEDSFPGVLANVVSGRIANRLGLGAANCTVDAACASSLAALRMAASELVEHRADLMITGGCDADNSVSTFMCFSKTPALSPSGRVRPFDASADGTLLGEGIGMLALKRLADAERDGDRIYAVLRGLGNSSDGRTSSIYAPSGEGQIEALRRAYEDAEVPPGSVGLVEAHGTGTAVGDAVELGTLRTFLGSSPAPVAIGSVKSQIGHTKAAAGAAGLIKTALALHHKVLPPTINVDTVNEAAGEGGLYVNTRTRPWVLDPRHPVRRGAVSAFGFGGVNFHAVLEEHRPSEDGVRVWHGTPRVFLWHAPDVPALLDRLREDTEPDTTAEIPPGHARLGVLASDDAERASAVARAVAHLESEPASDSWELPSRAHYRRSALPAGTKVAALFAGQGSQYPDMGLTALTSVPSVRAAFDQANALWTEPTPPGGTLAQVVFPAPGRTTARDTTAALRRPSYAQAAIGALAMGQYRYLAESGFAPDGVLGHSCGELFALWAAGSLDDAQCLALTRERGRAMEPAEEEDADLGAMVAARLSTGSWERLSADHPLLALCNTNAPDELVIGGPTAAVEAFEEQCRDRGVAVHRLPVAGAFHTPLMRSSARAFAEAVARVRVLPPRVPVFAGAPDARYGPDPDANRRTLGEQMLRPVDFAGRVRQLYADGYRVFVEFGPKQVLTRLVHRTLGDGAVEAFATDTGPGTDSAAALKLAALRLAVLGRPMSGIDRHEAPPAPPRPAPSPVARLLEGASFAVEACRPAYEEALAEGHRRRTPEPEPERTAEPVAAVALPEGAGSAAEELARAAADQLDLHTEFLRGQLRTAGRLTDLVTGTAGTAPDRALLSRVEAVKEHGLALSRAHIRAQEVMLAFARLGLGDRAAADTAEAGVTDLPVVEVPEGTLPPPRAGDATAPPTATAAPAPAPATATAPAPAPAVPEHSADSTDPAGDGASFQAMGVEEVERCLRELVAEKTGYTFDMVAPDLDIQTELGIDSLKQVEIASEAWRRYPFLPREEIYRFAQARTVGELASLLMEVASGPAAPGEAPTEPVPVGRGFLVPRPLPEADVLPDPYGPDPSALVVDDGGALAGAVAAALRDAGWSVRRLALPGADGGEAGGDDQDRWQLADWREETLRGRVADALAGRERLDLCVVPVSREAGQADVAEAVTRLGHTVLLAKQVVPALRKTTAAGHRAGFLTVTRLDGTLGLAGSLGEPVAALYGGLGGLVKALGVEEPALFCRALDLAPRLAAPQAAERLLHEMVDAAPVPEVAWDGARRQTLTVSTAPSAALPSAPPPSAALAAPGPDDLLVVTGGARGITAWCASALAAERSCGFVLLGRTALREEPEWAGHHDDPAALTEARLARTVSEGLTADAADAREEAEAWAHRIVQQREIRATLAELRAHGVEASYVAADVADAPAVRAALAPYADRVTGVIHGAGVLADAPLAAKTAQGIARVVDTKLTGLVNVLAALPADELRHLVLFTSVSGIYGNGRQTDYAMANEALNRFACAWRAEHPRCRVAALAWGPWRGGMASPEAQALFTRLGVPLLSPEEGVAHFLGQLTAESAEGEGDPIVVLGPLRSVFTPSALPPGGVQLLRGLDRLGEEPVLRDHSIDDRPVLPMTAAIGWGVNAVERLRPGRMVTEVRDFRVRKGLVLDGSQPSRARVALVPRDGADPAVHFTVHDEGRSAPAPRYEGVFGSPVLTPVPADPPRLPHPPSYADANPAYQDGFLFHGPLLRGLGPVLSEDDTRLTTAARLSDPPLAAGAYGSALYSPALADLLLQTAALLGRRLCGHRCLPVAVDRVRLYAPLPDGEPFTITAELLERGPLQLTCDVTAHDEQGRVLQHWHAVKGIVAAPELGSRAAWPAPRPDAP